MNKKTILCISLITLAFGTSVKAQIIKSDPRESFSFGIKAGFNRSNVWDEKGQEFKADPKIGMAGGVFLAIPITKTIGFQPEVLLSQKGFKGAGILLGTPYSFSRTTTYIDIPLQLQVKPIETLSILLGPQYSYLMNEKNVYTLGTNSAEQQKEFQNENIRKNILGFVVGADVIITKLVISGRMGWDFQTNNGDGTSTTPRYKNQWLQLMIGYKL